MSRYNNCDTYLANKYANLGNRYVFDYVFTLKYAVKPLLEVLLHKKIRKIQAGESLPMVCPYFPYSINYRWWKVETEDNECHFVSLHCLDSRTEEKVKFLQVLSDLQKDQVKDTLWAEETLSQKKWYTNMFVFLNENPYDNEDKALSFKTLHKYAIRIIDKNLDSYTFALNCDENNAFEECININTEEDLPKNALGEVIRLMRLGGLIWDMSENELLRNACVPNEDKGSNYTKLLKLYLSCAYADALYLYESYKDDKLYKYMQMAKQNKDGEK